MEKPLASKERELSFEELFGDRRSYSEVKDASNTIRTYIEQAALKKRENVVDEVEFRGIAQKERDTLEQAFATMGIYPWIEEDGNNTSTFSVEAPRDIKRLTFFSIVPDLEGETSQGSSAEDGYNPFSFPLPKIPLEKPPRSGSREKPVSTPEETEEELRAIDEVLYEIQNRFDLGLTPDAEDEDARMPANKYNTNLKQFKDRYKFKGDTIVDKKGNEMSFEEYRQLVLAAKDDPEKMDTAVRMSVGLVKSVQERLVDKFAPNHIVDADDLFQEGMYGLFMALRKIEFRETRPSSYLVPYIEGYMRNALRMNKEGYRRKQQVANEIAAYRRAAAAIEAENPRFWTLPLAEREVKIADEMQVPLWQVKTISNEIAAQAELFDEENPEHAESVTDNLELPITGDFDNSRVREKLGEIFAESFSPREELILRLYFGLVKQPIVRDFKKEFDAHTISAHEGNLYTTLEFNPVVDDAAELNSAQKMLLAMVGELPESVADSLSNGGDVGKPTLVNLDEVSHLLGVNRERIRQLLAKCIRRLKHPSNLDKLLDTGFVTRTLEKSYGDEGRVIMSHRYHPDFE